MGIFSKKIEEAKEPKKAASEVVKTAPKKTVKKADKVSVAKNPAQVSGKTVAHNAVILGPRITEKATMKADKENVFVFEITQDATKQKVRKAVSAIYNVVPVKVSIARNPSKTVFSRGRMGTHSGVKKAYVYLKEGDKIEIV